MSEALPLMLKELKLPTFGQYYQDYQDRASEHAWSYNQYLADRSFRCGKITYCRSTGAASDWTGY